MLGFDAALRGRFLARPRAGLVRSVQRGQGETSERNAAYTTFFEATPRVKLFSCERWY